MKILLSMTAMVLLSSCAHSLSTEDKVEIVKRWAKYQEAINKLQPQFAASSSKVDAMELVKKERAIQLEAQHTIDESNKRLLSYQPLQAELKIQQGLKDKFKPSQDGWDTYISSKKKELGIPTEWSFDMSKMDFIPPQAPGK